MNRLGVPRSRTASATKRFHTGAATLPPAALGPKEVWLSFPTYTTVTSPGTPPTNQASLQSLVVPVFPKVSTPGIWAARPVPQSTACTSRDRVARADSMERARSI